MSRSDVCIRRCEGALGVVVLRSEDAERRSTCEWDVAVKVRVALFALTPGR